MNNLINMEKKNLKNNKSLKRFLNYGALYLYLYFD